MFASLRVAIPFGKTEIDKVDEVLFLAGAYQEVVWLHVAVDEVVVVQKLDALKHLVANHTHRLQGKLPLAKGEKVLKTRTQQVHYHGVVFTFHTEPLHARNANYRYKNDGKRGERYRHQSGSYRVWFRRVAAGIWSSWVPNEESDG